jgi:hypothetical protein
MNHSTIPPNTTNISGTSDMAIGKDESDTKEVLYKGSGWLISRDRQLSPQQIC